MRFASSQIGNGEGFCNLHYDSSGSIVSLGCEELTGLRRVQLFVQDSGLLPLFYNRNKAILNEEVALGIVLDSIRRYRKEKFS